ncbi:MAG: hypothetical protein ACU0AZ_07360 [Paracoccaceae bacterium]
MRKILAATGTPLSSIFGSGFLIIVPILAGATGSWSILAMAAVCALAYAVGSVIRFNILHAEPVLAEATSTATLSFERCSDYALVLAYIISVCLYLHILSSFVLTGLGMDTPIYEDLMTTAIIVLITAVGITKGLETLGVLEQLGLYVTLTIILLLLFGFIQYDWTVWKSVDGLKFVNALEHTPWEVLTIVAGTLIVVQGFETTRYLGNTYDANTRVLASRASQVISTTVYLVFVAVTAPVLHTLSGNYDDNSLIALVGVAAGLLSIPLIVAAALSQFSAAVADTLAATGNMEETTQGHLKSKWGCIIVGGGAIALTWSADTLQIVALASRAFAFYYLLQCLVAISVCESQPRKFAIAVLAAVLGFITVFAVPAS